MSTDVTDYMLTTVDNPFSPFTEFKQWWTWDRNNGYHTPSLLARVVVLAEELSEADQSLAIQEAIDEIISENVSGMHRKVLRSDFVSE